MKDKFRHLRFDTHIKISFCDSELIELDRFFGYYTENNNSNIYYDFFYIVYYHNPTNSIIITDNTGWNGYHELPETFVEQIRLPHIVEDSKPFIQKLIYYPEIQWDTIMREIPFDYGNEYYSKEFMVAERYCDIYLRHKIFS